MKNTNNIVAKYLELFEKKRTPDNNRISLNYEDAINYDMYSVYIKDENGDNYLFDRYVGDEIMARKWDVQDGCFCIDSTLNPLLLKADSFSGIYYYHAHELGFKSLNDLGFLKTFKFRRFADSVNKKFSREKYLYRQSKQEITDVMTVLSSVVRIYRERPNDEPFSEVIILSDVIGKLWVYHDDKARLQKELRLCLGSLVENGDLSKTHAGYRPTGKAINTLASFNKSEQRYHENMRTQRIMVWATGFAALAGLGSMIAAFMTLYK
ncbi:hypothetical protein AFK62_16740 [Cronobacter condimenti 1330]|uniref:Uncharacterized protein n=1 Tax=Cronobacter condimenti 1330 TaxID=1073999 RepID=A0ABN4IBW5_9ENTR|nr:hypothetical protein [Cronobacter condimenti]ALB64048.1 hypothetical protein AFK62_16740 [Cronobacter condimenti 1330]